MVRQRGLEFLHQFSSFYAYGFLSSSRLWCQCHPCTHCRYWCRSLFCPQLVSRTMQFLLLTWLTKVSTVVPDLLLLPYLFFLRWVYLGMIAQKMLNMLLHDTLLSPNFLPVASLVYLLCILPLYLSSTVSPQ